MDKELKQQVSESAGRMTRAGMTLSTGILQELVTAVERQEAENAVQADYIRFLETELIQAPAGNTAVLERAKELGEESPQRWELYPNHIALAGAMNN